MQRLLCNAELRAAPQSVAVLVLLAVAVSLSGCASTDTAKPGQGFHVLGESPNSSSSWVDKLTAPFKSSESGLASAQDSRAATANDSDSLSLSKKPDRKDPELRIALAQMHERAGSLDKAEAEYKKALKLESGHLDALMGYAHFQDRRHKLDAAVELYRRAIAAHPEEAGIYNDLGLCLHRHGKLPDANAALRRAVALAPERKLYRNNLAALLVEQGQYEGAIEQLVTAHGQAAGHYNLGYLLTKKGDSQRALYHFQQAAMLDPSLEAARQWVARLAPASAAQPQVAATNPSEVEQVAQRYQPVQQPPIATQQVSPLPPQPGVSPAYLQPSAAGSYDAAAYDFSGAPIGVRYPNQQTSSYSGAAAAVPPSPQTYR